VSDEAVVSPNRLTGRRNSDYDVGLSGKAGQQSLESREKSDEETGPLCAPSAPKVAD
jgi:hypothetical protein